MEALRKLNPVSHRRLARDIVEMVRAPYPRTRLIPNQHSLLEACLLLDTGTRIVHVDLAFTLNYPADPPLMMIGGRVGVDREQEDELRCADILDNLQDTANAYTLETFAIHLLSVFDGDYELKAVNETEEEWVRTEWEDFECHSCAYPQSPQDALDGVPLVKHEHPRPYVPNQSTTIFDLPVEMLTRILWHLEAEDLAYFGQVWDKVKDITEEFMEVRDRELRCFVTKEHFTESSLGIGVHWYAWRWWELTFQSVGSEFDLISLDAFDDLEVDKNAYGRGFQYWIPLPLSASHWQQIKDVAYLHLFQLGGRIHGMAGVIDDLISIMEDQVVKLFTVEKGSPVKAAPKVSEKCIESLFFIFHLMCCVAVDYPECVDRANNMINQYQAHNSAPKDLPNPGHILAALMIADVKPNHDFRPKLFMEAVTRCVPRMVNKYPELGFLEPDGAASEYRVHYTFSSSLPEYRALMFIDLFQQTVRPATTGMTLKETRDMLFRRRGNPPPAALATLSTGLRRILAVDSFKGFLRYMAVYSRVPDELHIARMLRNAVGECLNNRGLTPWPLSQDERDVRLREAEQAESRLAETDDGPAYPTLPNGMDREYFTSRICYR
ncbi:hypothetical protein F5883DRAFT_420380 [Diaporthe sp. PMI_573]|nr:hypothetical protein F5883DRAFT_420380 [Diaporthaceae sp. PMI_573]